MRKWIPIIMVLTLPTRLFAYQIPYESWMGTYLADSKVGYLSYRIDSAEINGVKGYKISSIMHNRLTVLGADVVQLITTVVYTDDKYNPLKEQFEMSSGGRTTSVSAEFKPDKIECVLSTSEGKSPKTIPIPDGAKLVGDAMFAVTDPKQKVGTETTSHYFNPLTLTVDELKIKVEKREKIEVEGKQYDTMVISNSSSMGDVTIWQDDDGNLIKVTAMAGIMMIKQDRDTALSGIQGSTDDFAEKTSVKIDKMIPNPRQVRYLDIVFRGIDDPSMVISDTRQVTSKVKGHEDAVRYRIEAKTFAPEKSITLPVDQAKFAEDLGSSPYFDYELGGIKEQAKQIIGDEKNAYTACHKIRAWLYENMHTRADVGISRPASDVLKSKEGVCRDYAILFGALARASGIPSRIAAGLLYVNGAFYYHAWVECWVGEWLPFDGTLPTDFVDATHIKLAEGTATSMFGLARVIGSLSADVKGVK
jgi:hypothetical protein